MTNPPFKKQTYFNKVWLATPFLSKTVAKFLEQVNGHSKQSVHEISLSEKTLLEGKSTAFLYTSVTTWVVLMFTTRPVFVSNRKTKDSETHYVSMKVFCQRCPFPAIRSESEWEFYFALWIQRQNFCSTLFGTRSTMSVLRDPRQTSVCGGLQGTKPTQRWICLDALQRLRLLLKVHPHSGHSHPSLHQSQGQVPHLVISI